MSTTIKSPEQIAEDHADEILWNRANEAYVTESEIRALIEDAIKADRAQRQPEIYIVQNDAGEVVDAFRDADEATAAYQDGYSVIEETVWERGEFASRMIAELTRAWEDATGDTAADYALSEDDWKVGLDDEEAAEIARLIAWRQANITEGASA